MTKKQLLIFSVIMSSLLLACSSLWNFANRNSLESDISEIIDPANTAHLELKCAMVSSTRTGYCLYDTQTESIEQLAVRLKLERNENLLDQETLSPVAPGGEGCLAPDIVGNADDVSAYSFFGRHEQLSLSNGGQFDSLLLIFNPTTGQACVQVSYAYG